MVLVCLSNDLVYVKTGFTTSTVQLSPIGAITYSYASQHFVGMVLNFTNIFGKLLVSSSAMDNPPQ